MVFGAAILGLILGSFYNVCIFRYISGESVVFPPSHCPHCLHRLAWYELLPVVSYLCLRGRCSYCGVRISLQYPLIELLSGAVAGALAWRFGLGPAFVVHLAAAGVLIVASGIDAKKLTSNFSFAKSIRHPLRRSCSRTWVAGHPLRLSAGRGLLLASVRPLQTLSWPRRSRSGRRQAYVSARRFGWPSGPPLNHVHGCPTRAHFRPYKPAYPQDSPAVRPLALHQFFSSHSLAKDHTMKRFYLFLFLLLASLVFSSPVLAADSTSFDPTKVMVQSVGASIPVGTVITWPSNSWPSDRDNWLECNGQSISSAVYPELVALVGSRVPDYRGIFLRGLGSQTSTHYGNVTHSSAALGQLQGDGIREIWGSVSGTSNRGVFGSAYSGAFSVSGSAHGPSRDGDWSQGNTLTFQASHTTPVVGEIRPVNRAIRYLIRAK